MDIFTCFFAQITIFTLRSNILFIFCKTKSRSGIATSNRHLFLLLFIFTFNLRSIQEPYQQCSVLKDLDVVQRFQHEVRVHLRQRLCPIGIFYELLRPITFQEVLALQLFCPLLHEILSILHQRIPSHQICLYQRFFLYVAVGTPHDSFYLVPFTALPYLTVNARAAPPAFPFKYFFAVSANYYLLRKKYVSIEEILFSLSAKNQYRYAYFSACKMQLLHWYNIASSNHTIFPCYNRSFDPHDYGEYCSR